MILLNRFFENKYISIPIHRQTQTQSQTSGNIQILSLPQDLLDNVHSQQK